MAFTQDDDHFRQFAQRLTAVLTRYGKMSDEELLALQRRQLERLYSLEQEFRRLLIAHPWGQGVYSLFVDKICCQNGNILTSRPYFRERQEVCIGPISAALERRDTQALHRYDFNYQFILFALQSRRWPPGSKLRAVAKEIEAARRDIIELNMPLAISQARIFWSKAPAKSPYTHVQHMDLVQISCDGLISAADKFVLPPRWKFRSEKRLNEMFRKFRPMMVQRMVGNLIEQFNETIIHFYPKDKRKLYRANKWLARNQGQPDYDALAAAVNKDAENQLVEPAQRTTAAEINQLLSAATNMMASESSSTNPEEERDNPLDRCAAAEESRPDVRYERGEALESLRFSMEGLPLLDQKLLRLKGALAL